MVPVGTQLGRVGVQGSESRMNCVMSPVCPGTSAAWMPKMGLATSSPGTHGVLAGSTPEAGGE